MAKSHILGFPRIGKHRELKIAVEAYWQEKITRAELTEQANRLKQEHWSIQAEAGMDMVSVGDFAYYDHILNTSVMLGAVPERFQAQERPVDLDTAFRMARGRAPTGVDAPACEMTKWFDTNYHYLVPEFYANQDFALSSNDLFDDLALVQNQGCTAKPILTGPLTWLWLGKEKQPGVDRLALLDKILPVYQQIIERCGDVWIQMDEPILVLDLPSEWLQAFKRAYRVLGGQGKLLLTTYFGALRENLDTVADLPVAGVHLDAVRAPEQLAEVSLRLDADRVLSAGVINGRNVWRADCERIVENLQSIHDKRGDNLWIAPSCSLLHCPVDLELEDEIDPQVASWLAFSTQKLQEVALITRALNASLTDADRQALSKSSDVITAQRASKLTHYGEVRARVDGLQESDYQRDSIFATRTEQQHERLKLPAFPTTTTGSFPQTPDIRKLRADFRAGRIDEAQYKQGIRTEISQHIEEQQALNLDVLVHGEAERNDMVEFFGELLEGYLVTRFGWVQSYGSRCVKPPILYGDIHRPKPMTLEWINYAQSLTDKPVKGMLTGPVTMLCWSFVREDQPLHETATQLALAIRDEVVDLEKGGTGIIQVDEPALREGLPLRRSDWKNYLDWAVRAFRLSCSGVADATQIHTHMCYSEFNDIMDAIAAMDADVITIENSRSDMELLQAFVSFEYPNEIGPGVYDIHSPLVPEVDTMVDLLNKVCEHIPPERVWVNPDCGLKTRGWEEVRLALKNMVSAAETMRAQS